MRQICLIKYLLKVSVNNDKEDTFWLADIKSGEYFGKGKLAKSNHR